MRSAVEKGILKYKNLSIVVKASIWFTICNVLLKGISVITVPLFTRLLPSSEYGVLSVLSSYEQVIMILATWEIALTAYQKGLFKYKDDQCFFSTSTQLFTNLLTIAFFAVVACIFPWFSSFTGLSRNSTICLFIYAMMQPAYNCWIIKKRTEFDYKKAVYITLLYSVVSVAAPMAAVLMISRTAETKFTFGLIGATIVFIPFYFQGAHYDILLKERSKTKEQWKFLLTYQFPLIFQSLSYLLLAQADRVMIGNMVGYKQAAYYSVAYSLASVISIFQNSINQALVPWRFEKLENKEYSTIREKSNFLVLGIGGISVLFTIAAPEMMKILFQAEYYESVWCIPPVSLGIYFIFLYSMFAWIENYYEITKYLAYVSITCAIANVVLNALLIGSFGYVVCGYTTVISYILFCFGHYYFMKKVCKQCGVEDKIYDIRSIVVISLLFIALTIMITLLYPYPYIRYILLLAAFAAVYIKREQILRFLKAFH